MRLLLWRNESPWQLESPVVTRYILALVAHYLKNKPVDPHLILLKSDQKAKMKLSAKFKSKLCAADSEPR